MKTFANYVGAVSGCGNMTSAATVDDLVQQSYHVDSGSIIWIN